MLGSHLLYELVREHEEVVAIKRPSSSLEGVKQVFGYYTAEALDHFKLIDWVDIDLMNYPEVERVMIDIDQVYHCAGMVSFQPKEAKAMIEFNVQSTENIVNACLETSAERLVHVSSTSAIGRAPDGFPAKESMIWARSKHNTAYSVSKFRSEMEVWRGIEEGLKAVIVNPSIILGSGFWDRGSSALFRRVDRGLKYGTPGMTGYVGVRDVVEAMIRLMDSEISGERYILNSGNHTFVEIIEMIAEAMGKPRKLKELTPSSLRSLSRMDKVLGIFTGKRSLTPEQVRSAFRETNYSNEKIREALGFEFTPVNEVIKRVAGIYRSQQGT